MRSRAVGIDIGLCSRCCIHTSSERNEKPPLPRTHILPSSLDTLGHLISFPGLIPIKRVSDYQC